MAQRSTNLKLMADHCAYALDLQDAGTPRDRDVFSAGIAAHAVLQVAVQALDPARPDQLDVHAIGNAVVSELSTKGRSFDNVPEPPLPVDACLEGRDLALGWYEQHGLPVAGRLDAELGVAVDRNWEPCDYSDPNAYYRAILDLKWLDTVEDEESAYVAACTRDWKSSWRARANELETVQLRGQGLLLSIMHPEVDAIRLEIGNLRTRELHEKLIFLDDEGRAMLGRWRADLDLAIAAAEYRGPDGKRPATPGAGCDGCPFVSRCEAARAYLRGSVLDNTDEGIAVRYAVAQSMAEELKLRLMSRADEKAIPVPGGQVGYVGQSKDEAVDDAARKLAHVWFRIAPEEEHSWDAANGELLGLLRAIDPGVGALKGVAAQLHNSKSGEADWKTQRAELLAQLVQPTIQPRFGVHAK